MAILDPRARASAAIGALGASNPTLVEVLDGAGPHGPPADDDLLARAMAAVEDLADRGRLLGGPGDLGSVYEALLDPSERGAGAHYTPADVAASLVERVITADDVGSSDESEVWDPCCGGGAFLLAAADRLVELGLEPTEIVDRHVVGDDRDPGALVIAAASLRWWLAMEGADPSMARPRIGEGPGARDGLRNPRRGERFRHVVGNPPFRSQLRGANVRDADEAQDLRRTFGEILGPYTDAATLFLVLACRALTPGGRAALVLPLSTLGARDAAAARREVAADCDLEGLWVARTGVFDAAVDVCAPILRRRSTGRSSNVEPRDWEPTLWAGRSFDVVGPAADLDVPSPFQPSQSAGRAPRRRRISRLVDATGSWSAHALPALGTPDPMGASSGKLGDIITTAAPFREEYYALVEHVSEAPGEAEPGSADWPDHLAALITSGSIGVGTCSWGERPTTFARTRRLRPVVDLTSLAAAGGRGAAWAVANAGPKVIVATQTRIGEAAVDETGSWMASTPAIVVGAEVGRLWDVAAAICSPVASVAGAALAAGTGRSAAAIRHTASTVAALPLPVDVDAWRTGADLLRRGQLEGFSAAMSAAHAVTGSDAGRLEEWWLARAT